MPDFSRDIDIGKYTAARDRIEILLINTLAAIQEGSTNTKDVLDETIEELKKIRIASEINIDEEIELTEGD